jgi:hypothetical protein
MKYEYLTLTASVYRQEWRAWKVHGKVLPEWQTKPEFLLDTYLNALGADGWEGFSAYYAGQSAHLTFKRLLPKG